MSLDVIFAYAVGVLAALAVVGALALRLCGSGARSGAPWLPTDTRPERSSPSGATTRP
jgi:hypothetical protein